MLPTVIPFIPYFYPRQGSENVSSIPCNITCTLPDDSWQIIAKAHLVE